MPILAAQEHSLRQTREAGGSSYGFEKNDRANIIEDELGALQDNAQDLLCKTGLQLDKAVEDGAIQEICHDHKN